MTRDSQPAASSRPTAARIPSSSSGSRTRPCASMRSVTSSLRSRGITGTKIPVIPYGFGRVRRPSSSTSRKPAVVISPVRASRRSRTALVVVVVPCTIRSTPDAPMPAASSAAITPKAWLSRVVGVLAIRTAPEAPSTRIRSVNVPPTSMPATTCPPRSVSSCPSCSPIGRFRNANPCECCILESGTKAPS